MKRRQLTAAAIVLAASLVTTFAAPIPTGIAADALWFARADLKALKATSIGQHLMQGLHEGEADHKLAALTAVLNFDPRGDLDELVVYGHGTDGDGAAILRGAFDAERLETLVRAADGYTTQPYGVHLLHSWDDGAKRTHSCIPSTDTVVFADDVAALKRALDVLDGTAPSLTSDRQFPGLGDRGGAAFLFAAADLAQMDKVHPQAAAFKAVESLIVSMGEAGEDLYALVEMKTPREETAANIRKILEGMSALALLGSEQNPAAARLADGAQIAQIDNRVTLTLRIPVADVIVHLETKRP